MDIEKIISLSEKVKKKENIDLTNWKLYKTIDLFDVTGTKTTKKNTIESNPGNLPYVTTRATNNGVDRYSNIMTEKGNVLTVDSAVLGFMAYQEEDFSASDHVEKLIPKFKMNKFIALFICCVWNKTFSGNKFNYTSKASQTAIKQTSILLPAKTDIKPDFEFMEKYIKNSLFGELLQ